MQEEKEDWKSTLLSHFHGFSNLFANVMRSYSSSGVNSVVTATSDLNLSHIAMKLWLMLSASSSQTISGQETVVPHIWNDLWFAYEGFLDVLDTEARVGLYPVRFIDNNSSFPDHATLKDSNITRCCFRSGPGDLHQYSQIRIGFGQTHPSSNSTANEND